LPGWRTYGSLTLMRHRLYQRWFVFLGVLAMFSAFLSMPLTATYAFAMAGKTSATGHMTASMQDAEMPCHKMKKSCPDCPQKVCPEMGSCLVKCFQPLSTPVSEVHLQGDIITHRVAPALSAVPPSSLIPPLLRPPSV
jgi:hypothetical protein